MRGILPASQKPAQPEQQSQLQIETLTIDPLTSSQSMEDFDTPSSTSPVSKILHVETESSSADVRNPSPSPVYSPSSSVTTMTGSISSNLLTSMEALRRTFSSKEADPGAQDWAVFFETVIQKQLAPLRARIEELEKTSPARTPSPPLQIQSLQHHSPNALDPANNGLSIVNEHEDEFLLQARKADLRIGDTEKNTQKQEVKRSDSTLELPGVSGYVLVSIKIDPEKREAFFPKPLPLPVSKEQSVEYKAVYQAHVNEVSSLFSASLAAGQYTLNKDSATKSEITTAHKMSPDYTTQYAELVVGIAEYELVKPDHSLEFPLLGKNKDGNCYIVKAWQSLKTFGTAGISKGIRCKFSPGDVLIDQDIKDRSEGDLRSVSATSVSLKHAHIPLKHQKDIPEISAAISKLQVEINLNIKLFKFTKNRFFSSAASAGLKEKIEIKKEKRIFLKSLKDAFCHSENQHLSKEEILKKVITELKLDEANNKTKLDRIIGVSYLSSIRKSRTLSLMKKLGYKPLKKADEEQKQSRGLFMGR